MCAVLPLIPTLLSFLCVAASSTWHSRYFRLHKVRAPRRGLRVLLLLLFVALFFWSSNTRDAFAATSAAEVAAEASNGTGRLSPRLSATVVLQAVEDERSLSRSPTTATADPLPVDSMAYAVAHEKRARAFKPVVSCEASGASVSNACRQQLSAHYCALPRSSKPAEASPAVGRNKTVSRNEDMQVQRSNERLCRVSHRRLRQRLAARSMISVTTSSGNARSSTNSRKPRRWRSDERPTTQRPARPGKGTSRSTASPLLLHPGVFALNSTLVAPFSLSLNSEDDGGVSKSGGNDSSIAPVILLVEPSGTIGFGATLSSLLLFGLFNVALQALYVDGVPLRSSDVTVESPYALRLAYIPASPVPPASALLWFNGAATLNASQAQDCDSSASRPVSITFTYHSSSHGPVYNTTVVLDGKNGRPLLARHCTYTLMLLSLSASVRTMQPWAVHTDVDESRVPYAASATTQLATVVMHPQRQRTAGQPQQDWEAHIRRFSAQSAPFTYSDVKMQTGDQLNVRATPPRRAAWWAEHSVQVANRVAPKDAMMSNVSFLWSVGEITGDLTTATVLRSLDVPQESYALYLLLPSLTLVAHTVTLPVVDAVAPYNGVRFWNQAWMVLTTYYDLTISGAFPRSTLFVNEDVAITLRQLRFPELSDDDTYARVNTAVEDCTVSGTGDGDAFHCRVAVDNDVYDASDGPYSTSPELLDSCGGGVVVDLFLASGTTAAEATRATVKWDASSATSSASAAALNITLVDGFPLSIAANSVLGLSSVLDAAPRAERFLRNAAAALASAAAAAPAGASATSELDSWVIMRFTFIYQGRRSGTYQLHCDGSTEDMRVSVHTYASAATPAEAHCMRSGSTSASVFRHAVVDTMFAYESALYINASCSFRLATMLDANATLAAFCGVALEGIDVDLDPKESALLSSYDVYELRIPLSEASTTATNSSSGGGSTSSFASTGAEPVAYEATLMVDGALSPTAVMDLPRLFSAEDCYALPWHIVESVAAHPDSALYGQRWGGLGYAHRSFLAAAADGARYCHAFVAFHLPADAAALCSRIALDIRDAATGAEDVVLAQRVFCGSRSYFLDPISALQLRVPLVEVPRLVDMDSLIPDTEPGYRVYQYCVDVLFYLADTGGSTGAYAPNGPLIFTLLDTADTPSSFVPWVRSTVPDASSSLVVGDTLYFLGESLRYYDSTGKRPLTGARFTVHLAAVDLEACGDYFLVTPSGFYPNLPAQWINESVIALPITADVPGGWFNLTMTQGEAGDVYVNCGLSFRVVGAITAVTTTDVAGPAGGTTVRIRGVNLPIVPTSTKVSLTLGYAKSDIQLRARQCAITFAIATQITCTTPRMSADEIAQLALFSEESADAYTYWLPLNLTSRFYNSTSDAWEIFQSINVDTVDNGVELLSVKFLVSKMNVTDVWPLDVSRMEGNPTFHVRGTGIKSHSVLLCDVSTITAASTPETTNCILCLPRSFSTEELVCDALWPLNESAYRVYVSDIALEGDTGFVVHTHLTMSAVQPSFLYPYSEGVELRIDGAWFADAVTTDMLLVAKLNGGTEQRQYHVPFLRFTDTVITAMAPDLSWMAELGGTLTLHVLYGLDLDNPDDVCTRCTIPVVSTAMMPSIHSISPFAGQAPMLIRVYGSGFTRLTHSPKSPTTLARVVKSNRRTAAAEDEEEEEEVGLPADPDAEETYINIGAGPCYIVEMLNTLIVCNLTTPCANLNSNSPVRLISRTYGSTATATAAASSRLFFSCAMSVSHTSRSTGSVAGGQELTIIGVGFPSNVSLLTVTVAGAPCLVTQTSQSRIICITSASPSGGRASGVVTVSSRANGRESSCCTYTYDPGITPTLTSVSPTVAAAGAQLLLFGTNFPFSSSEPPRRDGVTQPRDMEVVFGFRRLPVTDIQSPTRASVTIPSDFFGHDYLSVHVHGIGCSAKYRDQLFTVLMTPSVLVPSSAGFRVQAPLRFVGTSVGANRPAGELATLFDIYVCGRHCDMLDASEQGEVKCQLPTYMDEEFVARYRASLSFPRLSRGFRIHVSSTAPAATAMVLETAPPTLNGTWTNTAELFNVLLDSEIGGRGHHLSFSSISIASSELSIVLEANMHSRLLLYNVVLFFGPAVADMDQLDLASATCHLQLSTAQAENADLFSHDANPANASMWKPYRSGESSHFTWPSLQVGANSLNFNALDTLPAAAYVRITCQGLPPDTLQLQEVALRGYQVGLDASGGRCPVNIRAQHRVDQPGMNSCTSRTGASCPIFNYRASLTPVVTRYEPAYALASDVGALITLYGSGFGNDVSAVMSVLLDKALCTPMSVTDGELVCAMAGRVSRDAEWQVAWTNESGRGEAILLAAQPFYAAVAWSSYLAWRGEGLPKEGQIVVIPRSNTILLDTTPPALTGMLLYGVLIISDDVDIELRLGLLAILESGALIAGSAERPHAHRFTVTLATNFFQRSPLYYLDDIYSLTQQTEPYLDKTLEVLGGTLQLHGMPPTVAMARLAVTARPGDSAITVDRWVPWRAGDTIALVTKDDSNPHHIEERVIVQRAANATHTVLRFSSETPLRHRHGGEDERTGLLNGTNNAQAWAGGWLGGGWNAAAYERSVGTDVVYLTRTICIRGDTISSVSAVGASVWLINTTSSQLSHVELHRTGKRGAKQTYSVLLQELRYPADWMVLDDVIIHDSYYRGVVLQATQHVVVSQVTVLHADGFGMASIGASDEGVTIQDSLVAGLYGDSGGADTVAAGLFVSSADVALRNSEFCVSTGHGVWFALRFLFFTATARVCPGQCSLAAIEGNRIHHTGGHGLLVYPLQLNAGGRCLLNANSSEANDPSTVSWAEKPASVDYASVMRPAGTLRRHVIFSCGKHGIYLPPSSGYVLHDTVVMNCAHASLFADYTTNTTVVHNAFISSVLPDGTCSSAAATAASERFGEDGMDDRSTTNTSNGSSATATATATRGDCATSRRTGLTALHGGHLFLFSLVVDDFHNGNALSLATLSEPSSRASTYSSGSFAALRSAHLTVRFLNFSRVGKSPLTMVLAGDIAVMDMDGQFTEKKTTTFLFFGGPSPRALPPNCATFSAAEDVSSQGMSGSGSGENDFDSRGESVSTSSTESRGSASSQQQRRQEEDSEQAVFLSFWVRGREEELVGAGGQVVIDLVPARYTRRKGHDARVRGVGDRTALGSDSAPVDIVVQSDAELVDEASRLPVVAMCTAPSKRLSLLFVHVAGVEGGSGNSNADGRCVAATAELRESDDTVFLLKTHMTPSPLATRFTRSSAMSFYILTDDREPAQGSPASAASASAPGAYAAWHDAVASTNTTRGRAGYYTLNSRSNITLTFRTEAGAPCYPSALSLSVDPSLAWPTSDLVVRTRVSPSASYFEGNAASPTLCAPSVLTGCISWTDDPVSDLPHSHESADTSESLSPTETTVLLSLAHNPTFASTAAGNRNDDATSLWAAVQVTSCGSDDDDNGVGCIGPFFPHLRQLAAHDDAALPFPSSSFHSWYSAEAWADGVAPWNTNLDDAAVRAAGDRVATPAWRNDAYIIPFGTRVELTLTDSIHVSGVLVVIGELLITALSSSPAATSDAARDSRYDFNVTTLVVLGKLNVSVVNEAAPRVRIVLGVDSAPTIPYRLDIDTLVYPGTLYAAGEVTLTGATSTPTVWRTTSMVRRRSAAFPACTSLGSLRNLEEWCTLQARWAVGAQPPPSASLSSSSQAFAMNAIETMRSARLQCLATTEDFLPTWIRWGSSLNETGELTNPLTGWRRGDRVGLTSGSSSLYDAEEVTLIRDIAAVRVGVRRREGNGDLSYEFNVTTDVVNGDVLSANWTHAHGQDYIRDETLRMAGYGVGGEAVRLTKSIEFDCAIPRSVRGRGCVVLITRQEHPRHLFTSPRFLAAGISVRHFGKGGQRRSNAAPVDSVAPLTFLPAIYVNVSDTPDDSVASTSSLADLVGYAVLSGSVIEESFGTALFTDWRNTRLFMMDSAIWYSEGGGMRLDGGGTGVFVSGVVVAGTRYTRAASTTASSSSSMRTALSLTKKSFDYEDTALPLPDTEVTSMCSVLLNDSCFYAPTRNAAADTDTGAWNISTVMTVAGVYMKNVVAGGSESEGFCLPWSGSGGAQLVGNNTAHSSFVGLFLFRSESASVIKTFKAFFPWKWQMSRGIKENAGHITGVVRQGSGAASAASLGLKVPLVTPCSRMDVSDMANVATFSQWVIFTNRYVGMYSSSHQNVTISNSDIFANPIGVALAVHPAESFGSSQVLDTYLATFPRCSCTAAMYNFTTFDPGEDEDAFWRVCQPTVYMEEAWEPKGCGAVTFIDDTYHYAAVLAIPSYAYVPLSYPRDAVFTAPAGDALEAATQGKLLLKNVTFGAVGELNLCESNVCEATATKTTSVKGRVLRSAAIMGTSGASLRSSASLSSIEAQHILYTISCAQALVSLNTAAQMNGEALLTTKPDSESGSGDATTSARPAVSRYHHLTGTPTAVLRLRPSTTKRSPSVPTLRRLADHIRAYCAAGDRCDASRSAAVATLQEGYASPYVMTAVYDRDTTLFNSLDSRSIYIPRAASPLSAASQMLSSLCGPSPLADNFFVCPSNDPIVQVRLHSTDDRVRKGVAVPLLFTRTCLAVTETAAQAGTIVQKQRGSTSTVAVLQPVKHSNASSPATIGDAALVSSAAELAFQVPPGIVTIHIDPSSYSEALEVRVTACALSTGSGNVSTFVKLPLLDEDATVHVWLASTRTMLESTWLFPGAAASDVAAASIKQKYTDADANEGTAWMKTSMQDDDTGITASSLLFRLQCGAQVRIHQLVYATFVLYAIDPADAVTQRLLRRGTRLSVGHLFPPDRFPAVNITYYAERLYISLASVTPDTNVADGVSLTVKVEALDAYDYNVTAATLVVAEFAKLFAETYIFPDYDNISAPAASRAEAARSGDTQAPAGTQHRTLIIANVQFRVVFVTPPLLPGERHTMLMALSKIDVVGRGNIAKGSLVTLATVVPIVVALTAMFVILRHTLPALRESKADAADARRDASSTMDVSAATVVVEPTSLGNAASFTTAVVVWVAGVLYTTLGATLDRAGVTRGAIDSVAALQAETAKLAPSRKALDTSSKGKVTSTAAAATGAKVARQLFLLPNYSVLSGTSSSAASSQLSLAAVVNAPAAVPPVSALIPHARGEANVARATDPRRSEEADRQRYVDEWRIGTRAMALLLKRGFSSGAAATPSSVYASRAPEGRAGRVNRNGNGGNAGGVLSGESPQHPPHTPPSRFCTASVKSTAAAGCTAADPARSPGGEADSNAAASSSSAAPSEAATATPAAPERVIPVGLSPPPVAVAAQSHLLAVPLAHDVLSGSVTPSFARLPPLPPVGMSVQPSVPPTSVNATDAAVSPHAPGAMPVAIQSILTTSILTRVSLAYPAPLVHIPGTTPEPTTNTVVGGAVGGAGGFAAAATPPAVSGSTSPGAPPDEVPLVLRGRGSIMFTTPDADMQATRALRSVGSVVPLPATIQTTEEEEDDKGSVLDHAT